MLTHLGFVVDIAADGSDVVLAATRAPYRAILMDCQLGAQDGYEATIEIRRLPEPARATPIIGVTGSPSAADRQRCLDAGMDDYVAKPFTLKSLSVLLARWAPGEASAVPGAALDEQVVARLERLGAASGEDLVGQLAVLFLADADTRIDALRLAIAGDDADAVQRSAHTLTGSSANVGAIELSRRCDTLARNSGDAHTRNDLFDAIEAELARVRVALRLPVPTA